jgi:hypothetical protein
MNNKICTLVLTTIWVAMFLTGFESSPDSVDYSSDQVSTASHELPKIKTVRVALNQQGAMVREWRNLWKDSEDKFGRNEIKFTQFRKKLENTDRTFDEFYLPRIDTLEMMNTALQAMIETYVINPGDWDSFKWRFSAYMLELDKGIRTLEMDYHY